MLVPALWASQRPWKAVEEPFRLERPFAQAADFRGRSEAFRASSRFAMCPPQEINGHLAALSLAAPY